MGALISFRDVLAKFYRNFDFAFKFILKGVFAFWCMTYLSSSLGYYDLLNVASIRLFLAVVCAFLPSSFVVLIIALVAILHLIKLSMIFGILAAVLFLIIYLVYLRFASAQGIFMLAIICLAPFNLHFAVAFFLGLFFTPVTLIPAGLTIVVIEFVKCVKTAAESLGPEMEIEKILSAYQSIINQMMSNKEMVLVIAALAIIIVLTYVIKQLPFDYSWYVAIGVAAIVNVVVMFVGSTILGVNVNIVSAVVGTVIGAVLAAICQFLSCIVDYPKKQFVQFEDDDYYYYVKAIPKIGKVIDDEEEERLFAQEEAPRKKKSKKSKDTPVDSSEALFSELAAKRQEDAYAQDDAFAPAEDFKMQEQIFDEGAYDNFDFYTDDDNNLF